MWLNFFQLIYASIAGLFFLLMAFTSKDKIHEYLKFIFLAFPFMSVTINIGILSMAVFDLITFVFIFFFYRPKNECLHFTGVYFYFFMLLNVVIIVGILVAESVTIESLSMIIKYISTAIFAKLLMDECIKNENYFYTIIGYLKITLISSFLFLGLQLIFGSNFTFEKTTNLNVISTVVGDAVDRLPSFFQDPQKYAQFLAAISFLLLIKRHLEQKVHFFNYILLLLSLTALMITGGRAAFGGWFAGIVIIALLGKPQIKLAVLFTIFSLLLIAFTFSEHFALLNRSSEVSEAYDFRYSIWVDAFEIFTNNPFVGIGIGNYANYVSIHNPDQFFESPTEIFYFDFPESGYLKLLTEFGAIGFLAVFAFVLIPLFNGIYVFIKNKDTNIILLIASIFSWMVGFYTVYSLSDLRIRLLIMTIIILLIDRYKRGIYYAK